MILKHYIDFLDGSGFIETQPPVEWKNFSIQLSFEDGNEKLSTDNLTWVGDNANLINEYITGGLSGGTGIFEGLPYQIRFTCNSIQYIVFDGYVNTASSEADYGCDEVTLAIEEKGKIDFLNSTADSFRFAYLYSLPSTQAGSISQSDFIDIYYVQGQYPQKFELMMTSLTLFVILKEVYETIKRIADVIAEAFSVPSGGITSALQLLYLAIYLATLIIALIDLVQKMIDLLFPFVYYHKGMLVRTMFQKACAYLGFNFSSTIINDATGIAYNEYIMPAKNEDGLKVGYPSSETGFFEGTFGDLIRIYTDKFNAEVKIIGNTLYFEHEDYFINQSNYIIPNVFKKPVHANGYNASEVVSNYVLSYVYDNADLNNLSNRQGTQVQVRLEPDVVINRKNVLLRNLEERTIPFTLPLVKTSISQLEILMTNVFNAIANIINAISSIVSSSSPTIPLIPSGGQVNCLLLDTHLTSMPKVGIYLGGGKTNPNSISLFLDAEKLYKEYHASRSAYGFAPFQPNQWYTWKEVQIPMCCEEYLAIKDNNYAKYQGNDAKIMKLEWNPYDQVAIIDFRVRKVYTDNLKLTLINWNNVSTVYT